MNSEALNAQGFWFSVAAIVLCIASIAYIIWNFHREAKRNKGIFL